MTRSMKTNDFRIRATSLPGPLPAAPPNENDILCLTANQWANHWFYHVGVNTLPRYGKKAIIKYSPFRNKRIPAELFNHWKDEKKFDLNICVMVGKLSGATEIQNYVRKDLDLNFCDFDNQLAIDEFCNYKGHQFTLEQMAKICYIVQHSDKSHCHVYWLASKAMAKRTLETDKKTRES